MSDTTREERINAVVADFLDAIATGQKPDPQQWLDRHPDLTEELSTFFADRARLESLGTLLLPSAPTSEAPTLAGTPRKTVDVPIEGGCLAPPLLAGEGGEEFLHRL